MEMLYDLGGVFAVNTMDVDRVPGRGTRGGNPRRGTNGGGCARRSAGAEQRRCMPRDERYRPVEQDSIMDQESAACSLGEGSESRGGPQGGVAATDAVDGRAARASRHHFLASGRVVDDQPAERRGEGRNRPVGETPIMGTGGDEEAEYVEFVANVRYEVDGSGQGDGERRHATIIITTRWNRPGGHDPSVAARMGEAGNPGPRVLASATPAPTEVSVTPVPTDVSEPDDRSLVRVLLDTFEEMDRLGG